MKNRTPFQQEHTSFKNKKTHEIVASILVFLLLPVVNCLIANAGKQSALYNSLSRLAWPEGLLWLIYIWGILNMGCFVYVNELTINAGGYTRFWHRIILCIEISAIVITSVGVSIPAYVDRGEYYLMLQNVHTIIAAIGFVVFYLTLVLISATLFTRNTRQALLSLCLNCFILIVGIFGVFKVNDPNSYCRISATVQILLFDLFNVQAIANYYGMTLFKPKEECIESISNNEMNR